MLWLGLRLLLLIGAANIAPLVAKRWLGERWSAPLDGGFGSSTDSRCWVYPRRSAASLPPCSSPRLARR
jgi:hypothetical protein